MSRSRWILLNGSAVTLQPGDTYMAALSCGGGRVLLSGGYTTTVPNGTAGVHVYESRPVFFSGSGNSGWSLRLTNGTGGAFVVQAILACANVDD